MVIIQETKVIWHWSALKLPVRHKYFHNVKNSITLSFDRGTLQSIFACTVSRRDQSQVRLIRPLNFFRCADRNKMGRRAPNSKRRPRPPIRGPRALPLSLRPPTDDTQPAKK